MKQLIITLIMTSAFHTVYSQLSVSTFYIASTDVDNDNFDGDASDACSSSRIEVNEQLQVDIQLDQFSCDFNQPDGFPAALLQYYLSISHAAYPVQNFLSYPVPYSFQYSFEGGSYGPSSSALSRLN